MRIKLRCPHCGDWFTLTFVIEEGEVEARATDVGGSEKPERPEKRPPSRSRLTRGRLTAAICVVAAVVIIWAVVGTLSNRETGGSGPQAASALASDVAEGDETPRDHASGHPARGAGLERDRPKGDVVEGEEPQQEPAVQAVDDAVASDADAARPELPEGHPPEPEPAAAGRRGTLQLELVASERCWIRVSADGVVVADATLDAGERRSWRADGFFDLDVGAGDAVRLYLNGSELGTAGTGPRVVDGLRITEEGIRGR